MSRSLPSTRSPLWSRQPSEPRRQRSLGRSRSLRYLDRQCTRRARLPLPPILTQPRQPLEVARTSQHLEPSITPRRRPSARPCRRFRTVGRLEVVVVHHAPASSRFGDEPGGDVAGLGHRAHGPRVDRGSAWPRFSPYRGTESAISRLISPLARSAADHNGSGNPGSGDVRMGTEPNGLKLRNVHATKPPTGEGH